MPHAAARIVHVAVVAWDDVNVQVHDGLAGGRARVEANVVRVNPVFLTLRQSKPNLVREVTPSALYLETERSRARREGPEPVPAWMLNLAWEVLRRQGQLTNKELLNELRVHRSSAVLAIMARLPGFEPLPGKAMGVRAVVE